MGAVCSSCAGKQPKGKKGLKSKPIDGPDRYERSDPKTVPTPVAKPTSEKPNDGEAKSKSPVSKDAPTAEQVKEQPKSTDELSKADVATHSEKDIAKDESKDLNEKNDSETPTLSQSKALRDFFLKDSSKAGGSSDENTGTPSWNRVKGPSDQVKDKTYTTEVPKQPEDISKDTGYEGDSQNENDVTSNGQSDSKISITTSKVLVRQQNIYNESQEEVINVEETITTSGLTNQSRQSNETGDKLVTKSGYEHSEHVSKTDTIESSHTSTTEIHNANTKCEYDSSKTIENVKKFMDEPTNKPKPNEKSIDKNVYNEDTFEAIGEPKVTVDATADSKVTEKYADDLSPELISRVASSIVSTDTISISETISKSSMSEKATDEVPRQADVPVTPDLILTTIKQDVTPATTQKIGPTQNEENENEITLNVKNDNKDVASQSHEKSKSDNKSTDYTKAGEDSKKSDDTQVNDEKHKTKVETKTTPTTDKNTKTELLANKVQPTTKDDKLTPLTNVSDNPNKNTSSPINNNSKNQTETKSDDKNIPAFTFQARKLSDTPLVNKANDKPNVGRNDEKHPTNGTKTATSAASAYTFTVKKNTPKTESITKSSYTFSTTKSTAKTTTEKSITGDENASVMKSEEPPKLESDTKMSTSKVGNAEPNMNVFTPVTKSGKEDKVIDKPSTKLRTFNEKEKSVPDATPSSIDKHEIETKKVQPFVNPNGLKDQLTNKNTTSQSKSSTEKIETGNGKVDNQKTSIDTTNPLETVKENTPQGAVIANVNTDHQNTNAGNKSESQKGKSLPYTSPQKDVTVSAKTSTIDSPVKITETKSNVKMEENGNKKIATSEIETTEKSIKTADDNFNGSQSKPSKKSDVENADKSLTKSKNILSKDKCTTSQHDDKDKNMKELNSAATQKDKVNPVSAPSYGDAVTPKHSGDILTSCNAAVTCSKLTIIDKNKEEISKAPLKFESVEKVNTTCHVESQPVITVREHDKELKCANKPYQDTKDMTKSLTDELPKTKVNEPLSIEPNVTNKDKSTIQRNKDIPTEGKSYREVKLTSKILQTKHDEPISSTDKPIENENGKSGNTKPSDSARKDEIKRKEVADKPQKTVDTPAQKTMANKQNKPLSGELNVAKDDKSTVKITVDNNKDIPIKGVTYFEQKLKTQTSEQKTDVSQKGIKDASENAKAATAEQSVKSVTRPSTRKSSTDMPTDVKKEEIKEISTNEKASDVLDDDTRKTKTSTSKPPKTKADDKAERGETLPHDRHEDIDNKPPRISESNPHEKVKDSSIIKDPSPDDKNVSPTRSPDTASTEKYMRKADRKPGHKTKLDGRNRHDKETVPPHDNENKNIAKQGNGNKLENKQDKAPELLKDINNKDEANESLIKSDLGTKTFIDTTEHNTIIKSSVEDHENSASINTNVSEKFSNICKETKAFDKPKDGTKISMSTFGKAEHNISIKSSEKDYKNSVNIDTNVSEKLSNICKETKTFDKPKDGECTKPKDAIKTINESRQKNDDNVHSSSDTEKGHEKNQGTKSTKDSKHTKGKKDVPRMEERPEMEIAKNGNGDSTKDTSNIVTPDDSENVKLKTKEVEPLSAKNINNDKPSKGKDDCAISTPKEDKKRERKTSFDKHKKEKKAEAKSESFQEKKDAKVKQPTKRNDVADLKQAQKSTAPADDKVDKLKSSENGNHEIGKTATSADALKDNGSSEGAQNGSSSSIQGAGSAAESIQIIKKRDFETKGDRAFMRYSISECENIKHPSRKKKSRRSQPIWYMKQL